MNNFAESEFVETAFTQENVALAQPEPTTLLLERSCAFLYGTAIKPTSNKSNKLNANVDSST